jgi:hypothetical protein
LSFQVSSQINITAMSLVAADMARSTLDEKNDEHIKTSIVDSDTAGNAELDKRILWRRDLVLVPLLGTMYMVMFLDRTNIANARIEGLEAGLNMPSNGYNVALSVFYVPFVLFEVPSNLVLSLPWVKPRWYLGTMVVLLGKSTPTISPSMVSLPKQASWPCARA